MSKYKTPRRAAVIGALASIGLAVGLGLTAGTPAQRQPATVADTIWGAVPSQPSPTPTVTASAATLDDTIWG
ncbi:hypothetical protein [Streptomyces sp. LS1784]|uniref:hypothetical protein n=1 Tax=Streptomyces sp. LS1784 TaxID=2851533 RepID=UPI001CCAFC11|nr:hypothetical protein [Streptomyces sp. LS1784]